MIETEGERQHTGSADEAIGRLDAGDAVERRGTADRAARVRAHAAEDEAGGHGDPGAARRAGREMIGVPGVARRRPGQIEGRPAEGEFMGRELAQHDGAGLGEEPRRRRILLRDVVLELARMRRRQHALCVEDVLEPDWDAVQRPLGPIPHDRGLGIARRRERRFLGERNEAVQRPVEALDAGEAALGKLDRRELLLGDERGGLGDRRKLAHRATSLAKVKIWAGSASRPRFWWTRATIAST